MHSFEEDSKKTSRDPKQAPNSISGKAMDKNFRACLPTETTGNNQPYKVKADNGGWQLEPTLEFDICENGQPRRYRFMAQRIGGDV
jgi:hypothetical protein